MKKTILIIILATIISVTANAQLAVVESGQIQIGNILSSQTINSTATVNIWGIENLNPGNTKGSISFGPGTSSGIMGDGGKGTLSWQADNGFEFLSGSGKSAMTYSSVGNSLLFTSNLRAPSFITSSDIRLKTNVTSIDDSFRRLMDLTPICYELANSESEAISSIESKSETNGHNIQTGADDRLRFGFIAQEVREIYPNLVIENKDGILGIDYTGFIPLLVDAIKTLSDEVSKQRETIAILTGGISPSMMPSSVASIDNNQSILKQNHPNPFNTITVIECSLPSSVMDAFICIYDLQGKQMMRMDINERGNVSCILDASSLQPGMYIYSLISDGVEIDSKKMILTD